LEEFFCFLILKFFCGGKRETGETFSFLLVEAKKSFEERLRFLWLDEEISPAQFHFIPRRHEILSLLKD